MRIALKSLPDFISLGVENLANELTRLQLAGIESFASANPHECSAIENQSIVDDIEVKPIIIFPRTDKNRRNAAHAYIPFFPHVLIPLLPGVWTQGSQCLARMLS